MALAAAVPTRGLSEVSEPFARARFRRRTRSAPSPVGRGKPTGTIVRPVLGRGRYYEEVPPPEPPLPPPDVPPMGGQAGGGL